MKSLNDTKLVSKKFADEVTKMNAKVAEITPLATELENMKIDRYEKILKFFLDLVPVTPENDLILKFLNDTPRGRKRYLEALIDIASDSIKAMHENYAVYLDDTDIERIGFKDRVDFHASIVRLNDLWKEYGTILSMNYHGGVAKVNFEYIWL